MDAPHRLIGQILKDKNLVDESQIDKRFIQKEKGG